MVIVLAQIVLMITLHDPVGVELTIAPGQITSLRAAPDVRGTHYPPTTHCLVSLTDGKAIAVRETCEVVRGLIVEKGGNVP